MSVAKFATFLFSLCCIRLCVEVSGDPGTTCINSPMCGADKFCAAQIHECVECSRCCAIAYKGYYLTAEQRSCVDVCSCSAASKRPPYTGTCNSNNDCTQRMFCENKKCDACISAKGENVCDTSQCSKSNDCWLGCCQDYCSETTKCVQGYFCDGSSCEICPSSCGSWQGSCPSECSRTANLSIGNIGFFSVAVILVVCSCCFCVVNTVRRLVYRRRRRRYQELLNQPLITDDDGDITEGPWECRTCQYSNPLPTRTCDLCGSARQTSPTTLELSGDGAGSSEKQKGLRRQRTFWSWEVTDDNKAYRWLRRVSNGDITTSSPAPADGSVGDDGAAAAEPPSGGATKDSNNGEEAEEAEAVEAGPRPAANSTVAPAAEGEGVSSSSAASSSSAGSPGAEAKSGAGDSHVAIDIAEGPTEEGKQQQQQQQESGAGAGLGWLWRMKKVEGFDHTLEWKEASEQCTFQELSSCVLPELAITEIAEASQFSLGKKIQWFRRQLSALRTPWNSGHAKIEVHRSTVLSDSLVAFDNLCAHGAAAALGAHTDPDTDSQNMHKIFRFEFIGEPAVDAGGVAREFFELAIKEVFRPELALFRQTDARTYWLNCDSSVAHPSKEDQHYFRFAGRLLGKALFDGHTTGAYLARPLLKHLLRAPMGVSDLRFLDGDLWSMAKWLRDASDEDLESVCLDFSITTVRFGKQQNIELKEGGADEEIDRHNVSNFLELRAKYALMGEVAPQLCAFVCGFYDVIPPQLLMVFDPQELELLLCGLPTIDFEDWRAHTEYRHNLTKKHKVVRWFWEVIAELEQEQQARLLQFVTGTSRVPVSGFRSLQSHDGKVQRFTLQGVAVKLPTSGERRRRRRDKHKKKDAEPFYSYLLMPKAHTCFNRLDIPLYISKKELRTHVLLAISSDSAVTGFGMD